MYGDEDSDRGGKGNGKENGEGGGESPGTHQVVVEVGRNTRERG